MKTAYIGKRVLIAKYKKNDPFHVAAHRGAELLCVVSWFLTILLPFYFLFNRRNANRICVGLYAFDKKEAEEAISTYMADLGCRQEVAIEQLNSFKEGKTLVASSVCNFHLNDV